ncbi:MmoB/DmpM family protein [Mycolicibacterium sp. XJ1819]
MTNTYRRSLLNPEHDGERTPLETQRTALHFANPYRRRISEYEQVLLHTQPNPDWVRGGIGVGGWTTRFPGGRGPWENYFTEARCTDWFAFRNPEGRWQKPYVAEKADEWRSTSRLFTTFSNHGLHRDGDPQWFQTVVGEHLGALVLHDYGIFMALASPIRDVLVDTLRVAVVNWAVDFLDSAQQIQAEKVFLGQVLSESIADLEPSRRRWLEDPAYAGARTFVEHLWGDGYDHIEVLFALSMIYEPLFGRVVRREFYYRSAPLHGDQLTPRVLWPSFRSAEAAGTWTTELFGRHLGADAEFGDYNRRLMGWWTRRWLPRAVAAIAGLSGLFTATATLRGSASASPRDIFETAARDWLGEYGPLWASELTVDDLLQLYDRAPAVGERGVTERNPDTPGSHQAAVDRRVASIDAEALRAKLFSDDAVVESRRVVLTLTKADEIEATVEWLADRYAEDTSFTIEDSGTYYRIDCEEGFEIDADEIAELLGHPFSVYDLLVNVSTTIGRAYVNGSVFAITTELIGWESEVPR